MSRAYFFGNMYLSSIQQGIQAGHVIGEMAVKYSPDQEGHSGEGEMFYDWAENHKVMILLNAGYGENITDLEGFFEGTLDEPGVTRLSEVPEYNGGYSPYPFSIFHESDEALGGAATCFGVILPPKIYEGAQAMRKVKSLPKHMSPRLLWDEQKILTIGNDPTEIQYNDFEVELMTRLGKFRLAN